MQVVDWKAAILSVGGGGNSGGGGGGGSGV